MRLPDILNSPLGLRTSRAPAKNPPDCSIYPCHRMRATEDVLSLGEHEDPTADAREKGRPSTRAAAMCGAAQRMVSFHLSHSEGQGPPSRPVVGPANDPWANFLPGRASVPPERGRGEARPDCGDVGSFPSLTLPELGSFAGESQWT